MIDLVIQEAGSADGAGIKALLAMAFGLSDARSSEYLANVGVGAFLTARTEGRLAACAALLNTRHRFGGGWVPAANIAHLAIAPEARGLGLARPFVEALVAAAVVRGAVMVTLFASARPVYRKCGFELAGSEMVYEADAAALPSRSDLAFRDIGLEDPLIARAYDERTAIHAGLLDRTDAHWREIRRAPTHALRAYATDEARPSTYVIVDASDPDCLVVRDWHAADGNAATAVLAFLGRFRSVYPRVSWHGGPHDDLVAAMPDKGWRLAHQEEWLARIVNPKAALEHRGYALWDGVLGFAIADVGGARRDLVLELSRGVQRVREGIADAPALTLTASAFAGLFTGFRSASWLRRRGLVEAGDDAVGLADLVFSGPAPWLAEHV